MPAPDRPLVALCSGKDCRKRPEHAEVRHALAEQCTLLEVKCLGVCKGPVVVLRPTSKTPLVLSKVRSKKQRRQLLRVAPGGIAPPPELARRRVGKSKRKQALRTLQGELA